MATYVISDIHGYLSRMFDVLEQAHFDWDNDELYVLGDMGNGRGSPQCPFPSWKS